MDGDGKRPQSKAKKEGTKKEGTTKEGTRAQIIPAFPPPPLPSPSPSLPQGQAAAGLPQHHGADHAYIVCR